MSRYLFIINGSMCSFKVMFYNVIYHVLQCSVQGRVIISHLGQPSNKMWVLVFQIFNSRFDTCCMISSAYFIF